MGGASSPCAAAGLSVAGAAATAAMKLRSASPQLLCVLLAPWKCVRVFSLHSAASTPLMSPCDSSPRRWHLLFLTLRVCRGTCHDWGAVSERARAFEICRLFCFSVVPGETLLTAGRAKCFDCASWPGHGAGSGQAHTLLRSSLPPASPGRKKEKLAAESRAKTGERCECARVALPGGRGLGLAHWWSPQ